MAFFFAIDDINKDPHFLPNITLGYHLFDTCGYTIKAIDSTFKILAGYRRKTPNYLGLESPEVAGFVGDTIFPTTLAVAELLNVYQQIQEDIDMWDVSKMERVRESKFKGRCLFEQILLIFITCSFLNYSLDACLTTSSALNVDMAATISHRVTDHLLSDRQKFPNFYRTVQTSLIWYEAIIRFLKLFEWNWVGIITSNDGTGETELRELRKMMSNHGICIEFVIYLTKNLDLNRQMIKVIGKSTTDIIVVCGRFLSEYIDFCKELKALKENITFILNESWNVFIYTEISMRKLFNCSIIPFYSPRYVPGLDIYMDNACPSKRPTDSLLEDIWLLKFNCPSSNPFKNHIFQLLGFPINVTCTRTESIAYYSCSKHDSKFYFIYTAVYMLAHALNNMNNMNLILSRNTSKKYGLGENLRRYIRTVHYNNPTGEMVFFNERGELQSLIYYANLIYYDLTPGQFKVSAEYFTTNNNLERKKIKPEDLDIKPHWKQGKAPQGRCNEPCSMGYRKGPTGGIHACCYRCVLCSDGEISNVTDSHSCYKCPDDKWPDKRKVICIPKTYEYLSYKIDIMTHAFYIISILCSAITIYILTLFFILRDTPIVKANNRTVSFILLLSILLSFLCVFFFLDRPVTITCMLRQMSFGVFFSITVSCVLAKTITVCIAFKASKPGSYWRKCIGGNFSNSVVIICSSVQIIICSIWLLVSPPYLEYDIHSSPGKIIIQCNEGSVIGFYSVLGYMGFLAAVSFVLAFMVRTLPDSFNEAKYITFSMLVFCSVWIAMISAYLSTRGKYMVAVEIFAILTSNTVVLGCIFFPKCYIIITKPERNSKKHILDKVKS
ncbi:vomeronasal type-2 receptor 26-like [Mantella aurantiaca]